MAGLAAEWAWECRLHRTADEAPGAMVGMPEAAVGL